MPITWPESREPCVKISLYMKRHREPRIPDVRDGLTVPQRRILFSMWGLGAVIQKEHTGSSRVVGHTMGNYHPFGDGELFSVVTKLARFDLTRYPLIDPKGDLGDLDRAPGYMKDLRIRLTPLAMSLFDDLKYNSTETRLTFDDSQTEPVVLPAPVPILLLNGSFDLQDLGAASIPSHNFSEVLAACIAKIEDPELKSDGLMRHIKGPDFPMGCIVLDTDLLRQAYLTGVGAMTCRGRALLDNKKVIINSLPPQSGPKHFCRQVSKLVASGDLEGIASVDNQSSDSMVYIVISVVEGKPEQEVVNELYRSNLLERTFPINFVVSSLVEEECKQVLGTPTEQEALPPRERIPKVLNLEQVISQFISHRVEVKENCIKYKLEKAFAKKHILEGRQKAQENFDEVSKIMISSPSDKVARQILEEKFSLSHMQARVVMQMQLQDFSSEQHGISCLELERINVDLVDMQTSLNDRALILNQIKEELSHLKEALPDERRSEIVTSVPLTQADLQEKKSYVVLLSTTDGPGGVIASRVDMQNLKAKIAACESNLQWASSGNSQILVVSSKGRFKLFHESSIPPMSADYSGLLVLELGEDETIISFEVFEPVLDSTVLFLSEDWSAKRVKIEDLCDSTKTCSSPESALCWAAVVNSSAKFTAWSESWHTFEFSTHEIPVLKRDQVGVSLKSLRDGEILEEMGIAGKLASAYIDDEDDNAAENSLNREQTEPNQI